MRILVPFLTILDESFYIEIELLLIALNIQYKIHGSTIYLKEDDVEFFYKNLNEYLVEDIENNEEEISLEPVKIPFTISIIIFLFIFYFFSKLTDFNYWIKIGGNDAYKVINGEFYRAITSLTLHSNIVHISSNIIFFLILIKPLVKIFKEGKAWFFIIVSGFIGNVFSDYLYQNFHISIGFSTSVFAVIGMLAFINFTIYKKETSIIKRYLPFAAAIALMGLTGTGKNVDVWAHIAGFFSGIVVLITYRRKAKFFDKFDDNVYKIFVIFIIIFSWFLAIMLK